MVQTSSSISRRFLRYNLLNKTPFLRLNLLLYVHVNSYVTPYGVSQILASLLPQVFSSIHCKPVTFIGKKTKKDVGFLN